MIILYVYIYNIYIYIPLAQPEVSGGYHGPPAGPASPGSLEWLLSETEAGLMVVGRRAGFLSAIWIHLAGGME